MIVLGADMHKSSHTVAAVAASTGELLGDKTGTDDDDVELVSPAHRDLSSGWLCLGVCPQSADVANEDWRSRRGPLQPPSRHSKNCRIGEGFW
jgi:hypothetical protein